MGYRSDVAIAIYGPVIAMAPFIASRRLLGDVNFEDDDVSIYAFANPKDDVGLFGEGLTLNAVPWTMLWATFDDTKWYDGYSDVDAWNKLVMDALSDCGENDDLNVEFIRVGEETGDLDHEYRGENVQHYCGVTQRVDTSCQPEELFA